MCAVCVSLFFVVACSVVFVCLLFVSVLNCCVCVCVVVFFGVDYLLCLFLFVCVFVCVKSLFVFVLLF